MNNTNNTKKIVLEQELIAMKHTNRLFLNLLYNLSQYPHTQKAKRLVRLGLFEFEDKVVFKKSAHKADIFDEEY